VLGQEQSRSSLGGSVGAGLTLSLPQSPVLLSLEGRLHQSLGHGWLTHGMDQKFYTFTVGVGLRW
jgi:hypothetical protein